MDKVLTYIKNLSPTVIAKIALAILASWYFIVVARNPDEWYFLNNANLIFHEAGHTLAFFLPRFFVILAGSAFQVFVPAVFVFYFFVKRQFYSASLLLFWVGESIVDISVYAKDAIVMQLPLLGGDNVGHDWNNLLSMTGLLKYTDFIGGLIWTIGVFVIIFAILFSFWSATLPTDKKNSF
jgi:hypothetical protein